MSETGRDSLRRKLRENILCDEGLALQNLVSRLALSREECSQITNTAKDLITAIRSRSEPQLTESFLAQYELSTDEGIALMCLAEALLRVPDTETVDALIHDKIVPADWGKHLGKSSSSLVNASTWALLLTGKVIANDDGSSDKVVASLRGAVKRLGEPVIRTAVNQAIRELGNQFVLGENIRTAIENAKQFPQYTYSYDMLGEGARTEADAKNYHLAYSHAISTLGKHSHYDSVAKNPGISVKLSALHPRYEFAQRDQILVELVARTRSLAMLAQSANMGFNIDAEEADRLDLSLDVIETVLSEPSLKGWNGFGIVVQAYSKRAPYLLDTLYDMAKRLDRHIMVRLVKGAYWDYEIKQAQVEGLDDFPVFTRKCNTDVSYITCAEQLFGMADRIYPQFATHNAHTIAAILHLAKVKLTQVAKAEDEQSPHDHFEFQRLHGMGEALHEQVLQQYNTRCRIYAPVGAHEDLLAYLVRRLLENGANSSFVNQIIDESISVEEVAADPFTQMENAENPSHPAITIASGLFSPTRKNSQGWWLSDPLRFTALDNARSEFSNHQWQAGQKNEYNEARPIVNPANPNDIVGHCHDADPQETEQCVQQAIDAFDSWNQTGVEQRAEVLQKCADQLETHSGELCAILAREAGKTLPDCIAEIREAVDFLRYYAVRATQLYAEHSVTGSGVYVCISPWNFPLAIFSGQIAAALACGNTVIAKPAEQSPLIAARAVSLFHQAGVPELVLQLLPGFGATVGASLVASPLISGVCFTGSTSTAQIINRAMASEGNPSAALIAETGGLNAMIIDSTALPEQAVVSVIESAFQSAGQRCSALRMLYVQEDIYERFVTMLKGAMDQLICADPWQLSTDTGPLIDREAWDHINAYINTNKKHLLHSSSLVGSNGHFIAPTLLEVSGIGDLDEEIFGPVLHIAKYTAGHFFQTIEDINASGYGLTFGLHTRVDERVQDAVDAIAAGNIYINRNQIGAIVESQPFGGKKLSGTGPKAGGPHYLLRFLKHKEYPHNINMISANKKPGNLQQTEYGEITDNSDQNNVSNETAQSSIQQIPELLRSIPASLDFCQHEIVQAIGFVQSHFHPTIDLPGPTGESNRLSMEPVGTVLCLQGNNEAFWVAQTVQSLLLGNSVTMAGGNASIHCKALSQWLAVNSTKDKLQAIDANLSTELLSEYISSAEIDAVAVADDPANMRKIRQLLSMRDGPIITVANTLFDISPLVSEKSLCIDTTAAGGNASLLASAT